MRYTNLSIIYGYDFIATKIMSLYTSIGIIDHQTYLTMLFKMGTFQRHRKSLNYDSDSFIPGTLFYGRSSYFCPLIRNFTAETFTHLPYPYGLTWTQQV